MKRVFIILGIILGILLLAALAFLTYSGLFTSVQATLQKQGGEIIVYQEVVGNYNQTSQITDQLYHQLLSEDQIQTTRGIGVFYDDPETTPTQQLRSEVGEIIDPQYSAQLPQLMSKYQVKNLPETDYITVTFPYKNSLSIFIGMSKAYPALKQFATAHNFQTNSPVTEIYDVPNQIIIYRQEARPN